MAAHARKLHIPITTFMIAQDRLFANICREFTNPIEVRHFIQA